MNEFDQRVARLGERLELLERHHAAAVRQHDDLLAGLERRTAMIEPQVKDMERVEKLAFDAYLATHPGAKATMIATNAAAGVNAALEPKKPR